jgi:Domain of unknown function (DUF6883)
MGSGLEIKVLLFIIDTLPDLAEELRDILLQVVRTHDTEIVQKDEYGQRYQIDFSLTWHGKQTTVRSVWVIRAKEDFPRLVTCYPLKEVS